MLVLSKWRQAGLFRRVQATMPSVTNTNNASICCGVWPERHGITGYSYFNERSGREECMETADLLLAPTLFQRAKRRGVKSALLSSKQKTTTLLAPGADLILGAEEPARDWVQRFGPVPGIHSREINYWLWKPTSSSDSCEHEWAGTTAAHGPGQPTLLHDEEISGFHKSPLQGSVHIPLTCPIRVRPPLECTREGTYVRSSFTARSKTVGEE